MEEAKKRDDERKAAPPPTERGPRVMYQKSEVEFEHPAKGADHCSACVHYRGGDRCEIVIGVIKREDWCDRYQGES